MKLRFELAAPDSLMKWIDGRAAVNGWSRQREILHTLLIVRERADTLSEMTNQMSALQENAFLAGRASQREDFARKILKYQSEAPVGSSAYITLRQLGEEI